MKPNELGELLRQLRGKRSLRDVAKETGLSHSYIRDMEVGIRQTTGSPLKPSPEALKKLSNAFHYPYDVLLKMAGYLPDEFDSERIEEKLSRDPDLRVIFRAVENLTESDKEFLLNILKRTFPGAIPDDK
ncbi:helix-turn-helix domain-containing protein [Thermoactinomyces sp. DSM 45892]|uniref:helix-turn-helix domain-containing protein n=1 Tax=Thermoactinomyces sp. DSM 45892 TaxID=1882753 RepID=UPI000899B66F|nr:helix-turn-helix transcriptional regulator [Thermoactinomyces sp. DSM 45892]SDY22217.1 Helix-turn-helix domain-containing protein [Thermoactinomyces sp. DSM 45892]